MMDITNFLEDWYAIYGAKKVKTKDLIENSRLLSKINESSGVTNAKELGWFLKRRQGIVYGRYKLLRVDVAASVCKWMVVEVGHKPVVTVSNNHNDEQKVHNILEAGDVFCSFVVKNENDLDILINKKYKDHVLYKNPEIYKKLIAIIILELQDEIKQAEDVLRTT